MTIEKITIKAICWRADAPDKRLQGELEHGPTNGADVDLYGHLYDSFDDKKFWNGLRYMA